MKYVFALWAIPLILFWGWYGLSYFDINMGYVMLTRQAHDLVFQIYGDTLGIDPAIIAPMIAKACIIDTAILLAIWAFRRRKTLVPRVRAFIARVMHGSQPVERTLQDEGGRGGIDARLALASGNVHFEERPLGRNG